MADQEENNTIEITHTTFPLVLEANSSNGSHQNPIFSNGLVKTDEKVECENMGPLSCTDEQGIALDSTCVIKVDDGEACLSGCDIEGGIGSISLAGGVQSSELESRDFDEQIAMESNCIEGKNSVNLVSEIGSSVIIEKNDESESESESEECESDKPSSSEYASSSSDSEDSSSSGSSSEDEDYEEKEGGGERKVIKKVDVEVEEGEIEGCDGHDTASDVEDDAREVSWSGIIDEDDEDGAALEGPIRSKNEVKDLPLVPQVNVTMEPHHQMLPVGTVMSMVSTQVVVEGMEKHDPLSEGSILWINETRTPLGLIDEIFGPVKNPYYIVRYNSEDEIPKEVHVGTSVSFVPEFADHVLNNKDLYKKGYDASGMNDEELSDEAEFSDDEKEAEYRKVHKMMKRGSSDNNHGKHKNNKKKASRENHPAAPPHSTRSSSSMHNHENFPPFSGIRPGPFQAASMVPPFQPTNPSPNLASNGVWTNGMPLMQQQNGVPLMQPQTALLPNGFPPNGISLFPGNAQNPYQFQMTGIPFQQQQLGPNLGSLPLQGTSLPVVQQPNIFGQPMYSQGLGGQNQMSYGMNFPQIQTPVSGGIEQGFSPYGMQPEGNHNFQSGPENMQAPNQFRPGGFANRGRKNFHQRGRGRKGWRPTK